MKSSAWVLSLTVYLLGCSQKYTILRGTSYPNPPEQRIRILVMDFRTIDKEHASVSRHMARQAQEWFQRELSSEYVDASTEDVQSPDAAAPTQERRKAKNAFIAVDPEAALQRMKAAGIDLRTSLEPSDLVAVGKLDVTDLVLLGSVGLASLPRLDLMTGTANTLVLGTSPTVPVARMGIIVADTRTGEVLLETRKQCRYREDSDPIAVMAREAMGEILWTSFF